MRRQSVRKEMLKEMGKEKKVFATDIPSLLGKEIRESFYLSAIKSTQAEAASWMELNLNDRTGNIVGRVWAEYIDPAYFDYEHRIVEVIGKIEIYRDRYELRVVKMIPVEQGQYCRSDYVDELPAAKTEQYAQSIKGTIETMKDERLKALCFRVMTAQIIQKMSHLPLENPYCYAYGGGLLAHISDMLVVAERVMEVNEGSNRKSKDVDADLVVAGIIMYSVGTLKQFKFDSVSYWKISRGKLVGVAAETVAQLAIMNQGLPHDKKVPDMTQITHVIMALNHVVEPQTKEAVVACAVRDTVCSLAAWDECFYSHERKGRELTRVNSKYFGHEIER